MGPEEADSRSAPWIAVWALAKTAGQVPSTIGHEVEFVYHPNSPSSSVGLRYMRCVGWTLGIATGP